jgi:endonuclease YncB( thermonuclease family)
MVVIFALLLAAAPPQALAKPLYGNAEVLDGDTLRMGGTRIRLFGIDAPEHDQTCTRNGTRWPCGTEATDRLRRLVAGKNVRCVPVGKDDYGRTLARCDTIGVDLNLVMVESGYAIAFRKYSDDYAAAEGRARESARGLWSGTFEQPGAFRARRRAVEGKERPQPARRTPQVRTAQPSVGCVIKGNRSRRGEWIYHLPGMPYYDQTRAEDIFCSEADARAAGYRRARVR